jgi:fructosamine-3-kinase
MIERALGATPTEMEPVSGGSISSAFRVRTASGDTYFCKTSHDHTPLFDEEAEGLSALGKAREIRVPKVIHADEKILLLEWIEEEAPTGEFWRAFGRQLAKLHSHPAPNYGWTRDNHIGLTAQFNPLRATSEIGWSEYFIEYRLKPMLHHPSLATDALLQASFHKSLNAIQVQLERVTEKPCLVHGDLWSGNFLCGPGQTPFLIDPAPYFGHREVDLAMSELFGGFAPEFYEAYQLECPTAPGYEIRKTIYNLYHQLNHWILFGESYRTQTLQSFRRISS